MTRFFTLLFSLLVLSSCVSKKKYADVVAENERLKVTAPIRKAATEAEELNIDDLKNRLEMAQQELLMANESVRKFEIMREAGKITIPSPEQMEVYKMQHDKEMQEAEQKRIEAEVEGQMNNAYMDGSFAIKVMEAGMQEAVKGYNSEQVAMSNKTGRMVVSIASKELFDEGKSTVNDNGKALLNKISVALNLKQPVHYRIVGVSDNLKGADLAADRAIATNDYLLKMESPGQRPEALGMVTCNQAYGPSTVGCERVEFVFEHSYTMMIEQVDRSLTR